jgi:imidazolonepropionase-like amidohydrolase
MCHRKSVFVAFVLAIALHAATLWAEDRPGGFRLRTLALTGARIVSPGADIIERGTILIRDGRIVAVGVEVSLPTDAEELPVDGLTVYPGFIDAASARLIDPAAQPKVREVAVEETEKSALAAMRAVSRPGITPDFLVAEHLKPSAEELNRYRESGFAVVHATPTGRTVSGQSAVIHTATAPLTETLLSAAPLLTLHLTDRGGREYPSTLMGVTAQLRQAFLDVDRRRQQRQLLKDGATLPADPLLDELLAAKEQRIKSLWTVQSRDDLERTLRFADGQGVTPLLWFGREAIELPGDFRRDAIPVICQVDFGDEPSINAETPATISTTTVKDLPDPQRVREHRREEWRQRVRQPAVLHAAGVKIAFSSRGSNTPADMLKGVRQAIGAGLSADAALAALTSNAAEIAGLGDQLGRIQADRLACLTVMTGPLENAESKVRFVILPERRYEYHRDAKPLPATTPPAAAVPSIAGGWSMSIESAAGPLAAEIEFEQRDRTLQGSFSSPAGNGRVTAGKVGEASVEFSVSIGAGDKAITLTFDGQLAGETLSGNMKSPFGAATKWTATRKAAAKTDEPPVQLTGVETDSKPKPPDELPTELEADRRARPAGPAPASLLIRHATILTGTGQALTDAALLARNGIIVAIGPDAEIVEQIIPDALHPGEPQIIDATNRFVMPGVIDTHSHIMIGSTAGLGSVNEFTDSIVAEVRVKDAVNTTDPAEYRALAGGVTTARLLHGSANVIGGQDAVVQLKTGRSAAEHLLPSSLQGIKFALGENVKARGGRFPNTRLGVEATLQRAFVEALEYRQQWRTYDRKLAEAGADAAGLSPRCDLRLEALAGILDQEIFVHSHCYRADEILMLLRVANQHGLRVWSLQHVLEGYKVAPEIVAHGASCSTFADWWAYKVEAYDATPQNAALLHEAGANVVIKSDDHELIRHLPLEAAKTIRYGSMPPDAALKTVTLNSARELGLADRLGSLEVGKQADLGIFNGNPLSPYARCETTIIAGEVEYLRARQPTAMSPAAIERTAVAPALELPVRTPETQTQFLAASQFLATAEQSRYAIVNAQLHPVDGPDIARGVMIVENGRIHSLGPDLVVPSDVPTIDVNGLHVYPGLIDAGTTLGLVEIGKVQETHDYAEGGLFQADLVAGVAINPDSELIPVARAGGITTIHVRPVGGIVSGQTSIASLAGWTVPEMLLVESAGLQINWPSGGGRQQPIDDLRQFLRAARIYDRIRTALSRESRDKGQEPENAKGSSPALDSRPLTLDSVTFDPRYESVRRFLRGEQPMHVEADNRQQIVEAVQFAQEESLKIVLTGAADAWKVAKLLKEKGIPVIVGPTMRAPVERYDPLDATYANPGRLWEAGVKFCIRSNNASNSRNAPFEAAMAVAYGLPETEALRAVTLSSAEILGVGDRIGSLTPGKRADYVIADGSPLVITSQIRGIAVAGKPFAPESRQTRLAEKYRQRLRPTGDRVGETESR